MFSATSTRIVAHIPYIFPKTKTREAVWGQKIMRVKDSSRRQYFTACTWIRWIIPPANKP
ncbi:unnamed protein product [Arabidopsis thaliana]|nr:unnamed protein product [Arabidopsis thaliana]